MDDYVFSVIFMKIEDYSDFKNLSLGNKKLLRVSKIIWKKWLRNRFPNLCSFVEETDLNKFFEILWKLYNGKLKEECSILYIRGPYYSGKSTLCDILMNVCRNPHDIPKTNFLGYSFEGRYVLMMEGDKYDLELYYHYINEGFFARRLYAEEIFIKNPAMAIIKEDELVIHENICNNKRRKIIYIDLKEEERKIERSRLIKKSIKEYEDFILMFERFP